ncbi:Clp protease N-terminal domain-containing protein [Streptomyces glaucosporus]|uniref:Clp protease N-terminal domain-containing protein n=1 Tax=Streptomyces glaucosporus TaxID=284044 RepID=A0ABP5V716_9ACTN
MHSPLSSPEPADADPYAGDLLGAELVAALSSARRRAGRDGDRHVDTAHLLHGLIESDPAVRSALGGPVRLTRLLGYLAQRSIGYGLRWQGRVEGTGGDAPSAPAPGPGGRRGPAGWSPAAVAALEGALRRARERGGTRAEGTDLLAALADDPGCRAMEVLRRADAVPGGWARTRATGPQCQGHCR